MWTGNLLRMATALLFVFVGSFAAATAQDEPHGWLGTQNLKTAYGEFEFKNGYPVGDTAKRLLDVELRNRAIEVYLTNMMAVSQRATDEGIEAAGLTSSNKLMI